MVVVTTPLPALSGELALFHTTDPLLSNSPVLVFYGPAASISSTTSRIQVHVFTPAGLESYTRLAISPNSPYYAAVTALPREEQGDEVCRGLAFGLAKYFAEIPRPARDAWIAQALPARKAASAFALFTDAHIAILATRMNRVENAEEVIDDIQRALGEQSASWMDLDVILPPNSIQPVQSEQEHVDGDGPDEDELCAKRYGQYASFIKMLGEPAFLPTSRLKRAPSKPTAVGRSQAFLRDQREIVRKEMCELVDTEVNYVAKLDNLVNGIASDIRGTASNHAIPVAGPIERMVDELFPDTLDKMLTINNAFLETIQAVLASTQDAADADIQSEVEETSHTTISDEIGLAEFARCLIEWFPKFAESYPAYMRSNARFPRLMRKINRQAEPALLAKFQDIGEKRLNSMLIEPVQRLPRYTLYIDSIAKQLPVAHPALKLLLRARDIISEICSQDAPGMRETDILVRLQRLVGSWPEEIENLGRLITITDAAELLPPYDPVQSRGSSGVLMLFTDCALYLEKRGEHAMTARALLAELGKPLLDDRRDSSQMNFTPSLHFVEASPLKDAALTEYLNHRAINIVPITGFAIESGMIPEHRVYLLEGNYAGKASRFQEEWTKAQVEGRFSEEERDSGKWEVRSAQGGAGELNLFNAIFEQQADRSPSSTRVKLLVDPEKHDGRAKIGDDGLEAIISMIGLGDGFWQIETESALATVVRDKVTEGEFLPVLLRRLGGLLQARFSARNPAIVKALVLRHQQIIDDLNLQFMVVDGAHSVPIASHDHAQRPKSPVKLLSSFLESRHQPSSRGRIDRPFSMVDPPALRPPLQTSKTTIGPETYRPSSAPSPRDEYDERPSTAPESSQTRPGTPSKRLEETLSAYFLALQARKGNIVGRVVSARGRANELSVNELYNSLLEDPNMMVVAAQSSIDVLFAAFEKFLKTAWKEQCGSIISVTHLKEIQSKAESLFPVDFERYFKEAFGNMTPQNQRALRGFVRLLAELLDGTGNDGDRGMLTAAFVEMLVPEGEPYAFVGLLDRFVDDMESLFGEVIVAREVQPYHPPQTKSNSANSRHNRSRSVNTGSLTSNTSSLRKKFGFSTLGRENSKSEAESKVGSVFRALSKSTRGPDQHPSLSRGSLYRAQSSDNDVPRMLPPRPASHDSLHASSVSLEPRPRSQDNSSIMTQSSSPGGLGSIQETITPKPTPLFPRKKRRSSLSDLKTLETKIADSPFMSPDTMLRFKPDEQEQTSRMDSPSPSLRKTTTSNTLTRIGGPASPQRSRLPSSFRRDTTRENTPTTRPERAQSTTTRVERAQSALGYRTDRANSVLIGPRSTSKQPDEVTITSFNTGSLRRNEFPSGIPALRSTPAPAPNPLRMSHMERSGLSERPNTGNAMKITRPTTPGTKPLKSNALGGLTSPTLKPSTLGKLGSPPSLSGVMSPPSGTRRLKMQSPQKLRERLQDEQRAMASAHSALQDELSKIGEEMSGMGPGRMGSVRGSNMSPALGARRGSKDVNAGSLIPSTGDNPLLDLTSRLKALEQKLPGALNSLNDRIASLSTDITSSLTVSESKARRLDELYREANAENEALYGKVNEELARVLRAVRGGDGLAELRRKLKESQEEEGRLRRENARLKREVLGLRSQLRE
ncbi:hypothetical protein AAFC00_006979 [Neodothiora populina]|uniref:DH domain-containing protein n=1 Tax=Neodothiora populina TaxID=2781224 RepID=A0ABR3PBT3_9PEZI